MPNRFSPGCTCCGDEGEPLPWCCVFASDETLEVTFHGEYQAGFYIRVPGGTYPMTYVEGIRYFDFGLFTYDAFLSKRFQLTFDEESNPINTYLGDDWACDETCYEGGSDPVTLNTYHFALYAETCLVAFQGCSGESQCVDGVDEWQNVPERGTASLSKVVVSCDPLLVEYYNGSTKVASITRPS